VIEELVSRWGYLAIILGTFLEGEAALVIGAAMAHRGLLSFPLVCLSALGGSFASDQLWFALGKHAGAPFLEKRPALARHVAVVERWIKRWGTLYVLSFRFLYGLRTVSPVVLGVTRYPAGRYVALNFVGGAVWALAFGAGGYGLGAVIAKLVGHVSRLQEAIAGALGLAVALWLIARRRERKTADKIAAARLESAP
jgi:membrane protein DedA with SNARE-associated domain